MEKKIINSLDNLLIEQTERLLGDNMEMKIKIFGVQKQIQRKVGQKSILVKKKLTW